MEDFLDHNYHTVRAFMSRNVAHPYLLCFYFQLIETETSRKIKREPALAMNSSIGFASGDAQPGLTPPELHRDVVGELWAFG